MQAHEWGLQWKRNRPGWMMWQVRENKPLVREQKPLKNSPSCIVESLADVSSAEEAPFPSASAEECSGISLRAWVRPRGCQKYVPSPALSYVCPQQFGTRADSISTSRAVGAAAGCPVQLCGSSISPLCSLWSLISNWTADDIANCLACKFNQISEKSLLLLLTDKTYK